VREWSIIIGTARSPVEKMAHLPDKATAFVERFAGSSRKIEKYQTMKGGTKKGVEAYFHYPSKASIHERRQEEGISSIFLMPKSCGL